MGQQWPAAGAGALGAADLGIAKVFLEEVTINPTIESQNLHGTGETDSWKAQTKPVCIRTREKGTVISQETDPDCPCMSRSLWQRHGLAVACCRIRGTECGSIWVWELLKEVSIIFITSTIVWPQVKKQGGNTPHWSTEYWIEDLHSMAPPIRTRPSIPLSQSLPSGSFHKPLVLIHQRAERMKTTITDY